MKMPRKVLVLGAGALKIGQSGEFDYSGSQALKALLEEGISTVLVNPNIATIQTSKLLADSVYFLPITSLFVEKIIEKERPDGILLSFGGQTALNCGIELFHAGILEKYNVQILGTPISAIILTEDRQAFARHLQSIGIPAPQSRSAESPEEAMRIGAEIGFPVMVRAGFALGGQGSGIARDKENLERIVRGALAFAPQVLIEQYLHHYKEVEYEVVRDAYDNCITVCNMENMDPLGIHTGESIVLAPSQTLNNAEYHSLRAAAITIVRSLGIVGECNVQFAINPRTSAYYVIEVNARLSRSSALASKATGYPLAYVAAKLALGYGLTDLSNKVTGVTQACFEPSLDYVVVKIPRWDLEKFKGVDETIGTGMKSVGEVMGIGRTFEEAYQKAIRMLDLDFEGATSMKVFANGDTVADDMLKYLYMTYNGQHHDVVPVGEAGVVILGSGPYRIGSSVEFDWTSVSAVEALKKYGKRTIVINCNPETVSTDYDISDRLYFEELTFERIADIYEFENPEGIIVSVGGQTPNNRADALVDYGIHILGTSLKNIDRAEDRGKFSKTLDEIGVKQPAWKTLTGMKEMENFAQDVGYPVLVRPSYIISGSAMNICYNSNDLRTYTQQAKGISKDYPVTISKFYEKAKEIEFDAVAQHGDIKAYVLSEHIENAGVHSGDATIVLPPQDVTEETKAKLISVGHQIADILTITGPFNIQFLAKEDEVLVIETNLPI